MADISIRNLPENIYAALKQKAASDGKGLETWLRERLTSLASEPIVQERYAIRFYNDNSSGRGIIRRFSNDLNGVGGGSADLSEKEADAYRKAQNLIRRNQPGDRENAIYLLKMRFDNVFEVPV